MQIEPSAVAGVELIGPGTPEFAVALEHLLGRPPDSVLTPALPWSVIACNRTTRTVAFLAVRFDMRSAEKKEYSVVHYADSLRNPGHADLIPGAARFVCAEPSYTSLVLHRKDAVDERARMNLANLRKVLRIKAAVDCVAFDDGSFAGPDTRAAFDRLEAERLKETDLVAQVLASGVPRFGDEKSPLARWLCEGYVEGGEPEMVTRARRHRLRIKLHRPPP